MISFVCTYDNLHVGLVINLQDLRMFHHDRSRLHRENVVLTREINDLRRKAKACSLQQKGVERVGWPRPL